MEEDLISRISKDDRKAFEEIFHKYYKDLCRFCLKYVRLDTAAEEIVQEVFINIWERRSTLTISISIKSYLFTAVRNRAFNYLKLQLPKEQNKVDIEDFRFVDSNDDQINMNRDEMLIYVNKAIESLPNKCRIVFDLSRNSGMTYREIAEELDLSVKTVENQVGMALKKLRLELNPIWEKLMILIFLIIL